MRFLHLFIIIHFICSILLAQLPVLLKFKPSSLLQHLLLVQLYLLLLNNSLLPVLKDLHFLFEFRVVKLLRLLLAFNLLHLVEFLNVGDKGRYDPLYFEVLPEDSPRANLVPAARALFLLFAGVAIYALSTELMKAVLYIHRVVVHVKTD